MAHPAVEFITEQDVPNALARAEAAHVGPVDHHWYEPRWNSRLQHVAGLIRCGETSLARVVANVMGLDRDALAEGHDFVWLGERVYGNPLLMGMQRRAVMNSVLSQRCTPETDSVIELGSGDGLNLFAFWLATAPRSARYMAFEIASTGRLCTELLGRLEPAMHVSAHAFDYYAPSYDDIPDGQRQMLVFTSGSIEQISKLPKDVLTQLLTKAQTVTGVHFEPVGWQIPDNGDPSATPHKERCLSLGYNENLWGILTDLQAEGQISVDRVVLNIFGKLKHPTTLIEWRKAE